MYDNGYNPEPKWKEECGVYGVYSHTEDVSGLTYLGLYACSTAGRRVPASPSRTAPGWM